VVWPISWEGVAIGGNLRTQLWAGQSAVWEFRWIGFSGTPPVQLTCGGFFPKEVFAGFSSSCLKKAGKRGEQASACYGRSTTGCKYIGIVAFNQEGTVVENAPPDKSEEISAMYFLNYLS
jgi:hypothetical protein